MAQPASSNGSHLFKNPSLFSILTQDARTAGMVGDPNLLKAVVALQSRPELYDQFLRQDGRLSTVLEVLLDRSEKPAGISSAAQLVAPAFRPTDHLWQLIRTGSEEEVRNAIGALGRNAPFLRETGPRGMTALMEAAVRRRKGERLVAALIQQGASVQVRGAQNRTALHWAAASGNSTAARALLDAGADSSARDEGEATPLDLALTSAHEDVAAMLIDAMERASRSAPTPARISQSNDSSPSPQRSAPAPLMSFTSVAPPLASSNPNNTISLTSSAPTSPSLPASRPSSSSTSVASVASVSASLSLSPQVGKAQATNTAPSTLTTASTGAGGGGGGGDEELIGQLVALEKRVVELEAAVAARDKKISTMEEEQLCTVCMERPIDTIILECAHTVLCGKCGTNPLKTCPVCNKLITRIIRTYRA